MAWVIGEYGKKLYQSDDDKLVQVLHMLEYLLQKSYDDEMTKCMLITAITKIHSNINFMPLDFITNLIEKYSRDKNVEIQQRCLEYKRLMKTNTKIDKNQFTTILDEIDIDKELSFLDKYVQSKIRNEGALPYDRNKYEDEKNIVGKLEERRLNVGPYTAPALEKTEASNKLMTLYDEKKGSNLKEISGDLKGVNTNKWTREGYKEEEKKPTVFEPPKSTITSVSSSTVPTTTNPIAKSGQTVVDPRYARVEGKVEPQGKKTDPKQQQQQSSFTGMVKKDIPVWDPKKEEKEKLRGDLFGGLSSVGNKTHQTASTHQKTTSGVGGTQSKSSSSKQQDLLGLGGTQTTQTSQNTQQQTKPQTNNLDLLNDIFGNQSNQTTQNNNQISQNLIQNLSNQSQPTQSSQQGGMFDFLNKNTTKQQVTKEDFSPLKIDTDTFGEYWTDCPNDEQSYNIKTNSLKTPQSFFQVLSSRANFFPVQIINNEAIAAAQYKNGIILAHTTVNGDNSLDMLVKTFNKQHHDEVATFLCSILKSS
jgi:hypothetical protein